MVARNGFSQVIDSPYGRLAWIEEEETPGLEPSVLWLGGQVSPKKIGLEKMR